MANASFTQTSFLGGEWSPTAQGRFDLPFYVQGMNLCLNTVPLEEGSCQRRNGTWTQGPTYHGANGRIFSFLMSDNQPAICELTYSSGSSRLRFWTLPYAGTGNGLVPLVLQYVRIGSITAGPNATLTLNSAPSVPWAVDDDVVLYIDQSQPTWVGGALAGRHYRITQVLSTTTFQLIDTLTGATLDGTGLNMSAPGDYGNAGKITTLPAPYTSVGQLQSVVMVQSNSTAWFFCAGVAPWLLTMTQPPSQALTQDPIFTFAAVPVGELDGPYLDPPPGNSQTMNGLATFTGTPPNITLTISDGSYAFVSTDVNRAIRLWNQPQPWNNGSVAYPTGSAVSYQGTFWVANTPISAQQNVPPGGSFTQANGVITYPWSLAPELGTWSTGFIASVLGPTQATVTLIPPFGTMPYYNVNGRTLDTYQLGLWNNGTFPTCGTYHEGRLWTGGAAPNRFDATQSNETLFSPTDQNGNVLDDSGISYTINSDSLDTMEWMLPDHQGILFGTPTGEWLITASSLNDPLTPTSIQAHKITKYKTSAVQPVRVGAAVVMSQLFGKRALEYMSDVFSGKFIARHLNKFAKQAFTFPLTRLAYQEEPAPLIWVCDATRTLAACTYRRTSQFGSTDPDYMAWSRHTVPNIVQDICIAPAADGSQDALCLLTAVGNGPCQIELMVPLAEDGSPLNTAWCLDASLTGGQGGITGYDDAAFATSGLTEIVATNDDQGNAIEEAIPQTAPANTITLQGLMSLTGQTVSVWLAGLDCGDYAVNAAGQVIVPYGSDPDGYLTQAYLLAQPSFSGPQATQLDIGSGPTRCVVPCVVGTSIVTQGQLLRPATPQDLKEPTGPGTGKTRRVHMLGAVLRNCIQGLQFGTTPSNLTPAVFRQPGGTPLDHTTLFTGVYWDLVADDYTFDGMLMWQVSRPYPCTMVALGGFLHTEPR